MYVILHIITKSLYYYIGKIKKINEIDYLASWKNLTHFLLYFLISLKTDLTFKHLYIYTKYYIFI